MNDDRRRILKDATPWQTESMIVMNDVVSIELTVLRWSSNRSSKKVKTVLSYLGHCYNVREMKG